ncbi:extracellular solute-binding protein [Acuticoccus kandeliae]|uniref:extracellular solute-binding protein n=1 Tax=Acuticoccus kandeliae TaxID=2073160 RepID=UPI00130066A1|nr:extracellular solute-binding protein [Acuticoccus kandeliae]
MHGDAALAPGAPLPYANPDAPQGGRMTFGALGTFDSLNPMIPRGSKAPGLRDALYGNLVYESLLERNYEEPFTLYGLLASDVEMPQARDWVTFTIDEKAAFSDGTPVTAEDVVFSLELLREKGWPYARNYYAKVEAIETPDARTVTFRFPNANDRELPMILGLMPILSKASTDPEAFGRTTLKPPIGTGPYVIDAVDPSRSVTYRRNPDYWGNDNPLNAGRFNAETVRFNFYRDETAMFEAFKTGEIDLYLDADAGHWSSAYDFPAIRDGRAVKMEVPTAIPRGMFAFVFNTRRAPFDDVRVREAMNLMLDFDWINQQLFYGQLRRTTSYFSNSELQSTGTPASAAEREMLAPYPDAVRADIMDGTWTPPVSDGSGRDRKNVREALRLFGEAGWSVKDGRLVNAAGTPFSFEILVATRDDERLALAYQRLLRPIGIDARVRYADSSQYNARMLGFDFDMARVFWPASLSPGNEQTHRWSEAAADVEGSFNYAGAKTPAIDAMIAEMLAATTRERFVDAVHALDRVLLSGIYVVPLYHSPVQWVARSSRLGVPDKQNVAGVKLETWWVNP